jgi:hypothetical protein
MEFLGIPLHFWEVTFRALRAIYFMSFLSCEVGFLLWLV